MMKVKAKAEGFYGGVRRRKGDVFDVADEKALGSWMDPLETKAPEKEPKKQTAQTKKQTKAPEKTKNK